MKFNNKINNTTDIIVDSAVISITDKNGNRYEIQEVEGCAGLKIRCQDGTVNIKPSCDNVIFVSTNKIK